MKNIGDYNIVTRQEIRRLREILTFEEYEKVVRRIINMAINSESEKIALDAATFIVERIEGKLPNEVTVTERTMSIADAITDDESNT